MRGTSLENNFIKNRIDSDEYVDGFYKLIIPTNISKYGTVSKITYIGTSTCLKTIKAGDIIFGGEGYGKGKSFVVIEEDGNIARGFNINAGIYELDKSMKYLQSKLEQAIECIADDEEVDISF